MMEVKIAGDLAVKYPGINIGCLLLTDFLVETTNESIEVLKRQVESSLVNSEYTTVTISQHPSINAWRQMYRSFGSKPSKYKCSAESLLRRVLKGDKIPAINTIVDLYNSMSIKYFIPVAAYDLDKIEKHVELRFSRSGDTFQPLGQSDREESKTGEVVYADANEVLCRKWNYRDSDKTKVELTTKNIIFFIDGAQGVDIKNVEKTIDDLKNTLYTTWKKKTKDFILGPSKNKLSFVIET
ncbi:MAG: B3/B4 domain-containing protein [Candidatus Hodarchaeales archaeon]